MSKTNKPARKTFYLDTNKEKPVTAGGVIIYRFVKNDMELLLVESRGGLEDLGGRADDDDKDIYTTVAREAFEESNELLNKTKIKKRLKNAPFFYMKTSKYVTFVICANDDEEELVSKDFGDNEIHDNFARKIKWVPIYTFLSPEVIKSKLNFRLRIKGLFDKIKEINNNKKLEFNMLSDSSKNISDSDDDTVKKPKKTK